MTISNEYAEFVRTHVQRDGRDRDRETLFLQAVLGICSESGEIAGVAKKALFEGWQDEPEEVWRDKILNEMGDKLFYFQELCQVMDVSLFQIMQINMDKLNARFPKGHYNAADSNMRADEVVSTEFA